MDTIGYQLVYFSGKTYRRYVMVCFSTMAGNSVSQPITFQHGHVVRAIVVSAVAISWMLRSSKEDFNDSSIHVFLPLTLEKSFPIS